MKKIIYGVTVLGMSLMLSSTIASAATGTWWSSMQKDWNGVQQQRHLIFPRMEE